MSWLDTVSRTSITPVQFDAANRASAAISGPPSSSTPGTGPAAAPSSKPTATGPARPGSARTGAGAAGGAAADGSFAQLVSMMNQGQQSNAELLTLQQKMQEQDRYFTSVSNVLKARHETMKSTISNLS